ncbi:phage tail protein [Romeria aff. gracilis LEGE 07310]|uniref:Phage tail protein n=1 Tax=Vasconcelosia minhoensis LEGE 07310 TaxID=915328 RepID=A0A8J7A9L9_9CYAN|nr:phage tail protein [Romeria gracilis]MBE9079832.1 phage tail protein [Romeria aff. gracilis LEGE 07310]
MALNQAATNRPAASAGGNGSGSNRTAPSVATNYVTSNRFYVEIESKITACFTECSGLGVQIKKETVAEGGLNDQQRILLGTPEFSDVTLKRGMSGNQVFWDWLNALFKPRTAGVKLSQHRRNVNILVFNQAGQTQQCWTLIGAVPIGWQAPSLQAEGNAVAIEALTLAYEGLNVTFGSGGGGATLLTGRSDTGYFASK